MYQAGMGEISQKKLGEFLAAGRKQKGLTLRAVEEGAKVSNGYLSQLESGRIAEPSPSVLHRLSTLYELSYAKALVLAGHPMPASISPADSTDVPHPLAARIGTVTDAEADELAEYLKFLRRRRGVVSK
jgi:HTH-type transcriptional regulator, competence development regulator